MQESSYIAVCYYVVVVPCTDVRSDRIEILPCHVQRRAKGPFVCGAALVCHIALCAVQRRMAVSAGPESLLVSAGVLALRSDIEVWKHYVVPSDS